MSNNETKQNKSEGDGKIYKLYGSCSMCGTHYKDSVPGYFQSEDTGNILCFSCVGFLSQQVQGQIGVHGLKIDEAQRAAKKSAEQVKEEENKPLPMPHEIYSILSKEIIGQKAAKKKMSIAIAEHYRRVRLNTNEKSNILLLGPTGSGKTALAQAAARLLKVPFLVADVTTFTPRGYIGDSIDSIIERLLMNANFDVPKAEKGIVFLDEFDKLVVRKGRDGELKQQGVQQELLKLIEGDKIYIKRGQGPEQREYVVDTSRILFIASGAFVGLEDIVREERGAKSLGIIASVKREEFDKSKTVKWEDEITTKHLQVFGMIPELSGRLPIVTYTNELSKDDLVTILKNNGSKLDYYKELLTREGVSIDFHDDFVDAVAGEAVKQKMGARSLRKILDAKMEDIMFDMHKYVGRHLVLKKDGVSDSEQSPKPKQKKGEKKQVNLP